MASFPRSFWTANVTELFERAAYYSMASFVVIYLGQLGLGDYLPSTLNGVLWTLVYFLPVLSGTIADQIGFKKSLIIAFVLLFSGYFMMSFPVFIQGKTLSSNIEKEITSGIDTVIPILFAILLIGIGGSFVKPCISGTVQKTSSGRATLAFAIFYMVINIGSLTGRGVAYLVRTRSSLTFIFVVASICAIVALLIVLFFYNDPEKELNLQTTNRPQKGIKEILLNMILVLKNVRFALFLLVTSGFFFLYAQVYNVLPLYLKKVLETNPPVDLYTMANPLVIVFFQLIITRLFGGLKPIVSIIVGIVIISLSMAINIIPLFLEGGVYRDFLSIMPLGSLFIVMTVALIAFGELFASARTYEYIGALAPKGQEGLFLGYANLPMAIGALLGGPVGAFIFNEIMCKNATRLDNGLLRLDNRSATLGWVILMLIGFASAISMYLYNRWITRHRAE
jgi:POT family proton-dependent oligopeptide transporter